MTELDSYCLPYDDGAAPNPFWGTCTLAICKPAIRKAAQPGDWVVGTGSVNSPIGDMAGTVVYAMRVTEAMTMAEYDAWARVKKPQKMPDITSHDLRRVVGDSIYDFSRTGVPQRPGAHTEGNRATDLAGGRVLLSDHFLYLGDHPIPLPTALRPMVKQGQGHRSIANDPYLSRFVTWLGSLGYKWNSLVGQPQLWSTLPAASLPRACASARQDQATADLAECAS